MTTLTVTQARKQLFRLLDEANSSHTPIHRNWGRWQKKEIVEPTNSSEVRETLHISFATVPDRRLAWKAP
jgi:hypothetical protein